VSAEVVVDLPNSVIEDVVSITVAGADSSGAAGS